MLRNSLYTANATLGIDLLSGMSPLPVTVVHLESTIFISLYPCNFSVYFNADYTFWSIAKEQFTAEVKYVGLHYIFNVNRV